MPDPESSSALPRIFGPYRLLELLGRGATSEVFKAVRVLPDGLEAHFALKIMLPR